MSAHCIYRFLLFLVISFVVEGGLTNNRKNLMKDDDSTEYINDMESSSTTIPDVLPDPVQDLAGTIDGNKLTVTWSYPGEETTTWSSTTVTFSSSSETETETSRSTVILTSSSEIETPSSTETSTFSTTTLGHPVKTSDITFMVYWDGEEYPTANMTWDTDEFSDGDNKTVCVAAVKEDLLSHIECTIAEDVGGDEDNLALIIGLSIGIPAALCLIGLIIYKVRKDRSSDNSRESDISMNRQPRGQDNPQKSNDVLISEFNKLKSLSNDRTSNIARKYKDKNPYTDVLPYDDTLVKLKGVEYMNASYIMGKKFIVSPDPMPDQDNDIWQLIYECDVRVIVRISAGGEQKPMAQYIPDHAGDSWVMGADEVDINLQSSQQWDGYAENTLKLKKNGDSRELKHFHLTNWPEGSAQNQKDQAKVLRLISSGRNFLKKPGNGKTPILIHCGAGSGRAGTLTGIWHLMDQHDNREQGHTYRCVEAMRKDRVGMVQNQEQYNFMYNCITEYENKSHIYRGSENEYGEYEQ